MADIGPIDKSGRKPGVIILAGPTASGKTALAVGLARRFGGEVVNADSIQLYADLPILTARPSEREMASVPHHLYGIQDPYQETSAMEWRGQVLIAIQNIWSRGGLPIVTGGTGLYLNTLLDGLSPIPDIPLDIRQKWRRWVADVGAEEAHRYLVSVDPNMASRLRPSDTQRNTRALEVWDATGRSLIYWQSQPPAEPGIREKCAVFILSQDREWIVDRCNRRFDVMIESGAVAEVENLLRRGVAKEAGVFRALGAREIASALKGDTSWDEAVEKSKIATRQYAKRQANWFRTQIGSGVRCDEQDSEMLLHEIGNIIVNYGLTIG